MASRLEFFPSIGTLPVVSYCRCGALSQWIGKEALLTVSALCSSTLSQCIHAAAALLYPFSWAHTYIPVVPESLLDTVCCPTPFMVGVQTRFQQEVMDSPMEEVSCLKESTRFRVWWAWICIPALLSATV